MKSLCILIFGLSIATTGWAGSWLQAGVGNDDLVWGASGGIRWAIHPSPVDGKGNGGPRGLIRVGAPTLAGGRYDLINFIAVEPTTTSGAKGLSELERGGDGKPGKRMWIDTQPGHLLDPGLIRQVDGGAEDLNVRIRVEKFDNGAHVQVVASIRSDRPDEIRFTVYAEPDSAPLREVVLTATMGNRERVRKVVLKGRELDSLALYGGHRGNGFAPDHAEPAGELARTPQGDVIVPFTTNEENPAATRTNPPNWYYGGRKVTQYWKKAGGDAGRNLTLHVNGRAEYWATPLPIPGGVSFENVELRDGWADGEQWIFGISTLSPRELIDGGIGTFQNGPSLLGVLSGRP